MGKWQLGLNLERTIGMMDMGGVRSLRISSNREKHGTVQPMITGINPDGSAIASSMSVAVEAKHSRSDQTADRGGLKLHNSNWTDVEISISLQALGETLNDKRLSRKEINSWTPYVDRAVRRGLTKEGLRHLLLNHSQEQLIAAIAFNLSKITNFTAITGLFVKELAPLMPSLLLASVFSWIVPFGMLTSSGLENYGRNANGKGFRISSVPGYEIDRALALLVISRKPIVSSIRNI